MSASERLDALGVILPAVPQPVAAYQPAVRSGDLVYTSGQVPMVDGRPVATGKLGAELTLEQGVAAARVCALNAIAAAAEQAGGIDNIAQIVKATIFVASHPDWHDQPKVGNGASELLADVFGDAGQHARSAVGVAVLPLDVPVEVELIVRVR